jgi:hypothetical protein
VDAGIKNHQEQNVVNRLSYFVRVAGRYPIPRTPEEWTPKTVPGRGRVYPGFFSPEDWEVATRVARRLLGNLKTTMFASSA